MIEIATIYFLLLVHWLELIFGAVVSSGIKGVSVSNLTVALVFMGWLINIAFKRADLQWTNVYLVVLALVWVVAMSIPYKAAHGEFGRVSMVGEIITLKNWIEPFILFILVFNLARSKMIVKRITFGLMIYVVLSVIVTFLVVTNTFLIGEITSQRGGYWIKVDTNQFAAYLVLVIPLFFSYLLFGKGKYSRFTAAGCCLLILFTLIASGSRGGFVSFVFVVAVYLWLLKGLGKTNQKGLFTGGAIIAVLIVIAIVATPSDITERTSARVEFEEAEDLDSFSSGRLWRWELAWQYFSARPLFGLGQGGYRLMAGTDAHNTYLTYLVDHGAIGCGLFTLFLFGLLMGSRKGLKNTTDPFGVILFSAFFSGLAGFSLAIFFVRVFQLWSIVMIYGALVLKYAQLEARERSRAAPQIRSQSLADGVGGIPRGV